MATKTKAIKQEEVVIPPMDIRIFTVRIEGTTRLVTHGWSDKSKEDIRKTQKHEPKRARGAKDPWSDYCDSLYWLTPKPNNPTQEDIDKAKFGFPAGAFKSAAISAIRQIDGMTMAGSTGMFHVLGEFIEIEGKPEMREDMVRVGMGVADIRYRAEFPNWACNVTFEYNARVISAAQIISLLDNAGFAVGLGEGRPEKSKSLGWGKFRVLIDRIV